MRKYDQLWEITNSLISVFHQFANIHFDLVNLKIFVLSVFGFNLFDK
jgi:hypothetical protein